MFMIWSMCLHPMQCRWSPHHHCLGWWPTPIHIIWQTHATNEGRHMFSMGGNGHGRPHENHRHQNHPQRWLHPSHSRNTSNPFYTTNTWTTPIRWQHLLIPTSGYNQIWMGMRATKATHMQNSLENCSSLPMRHDSALHTPWTDLLLTQQTWVSNTPEHWGEYFAILLELKAMG